MTCPHCGTAVAGVGRFCSGCGQALPTADAPSSSALATTARCPFCETTMAPVPYMSRGLNLAKAALLFVPFNAVGPLVFILLRKDRAICPHCNTLLPGETSIPLASTFSPTPVRPPAVLAEFSTMPREGQQAVVAESKAGTRRVVAWIAGFFGASIGAVGALALAADAPGFVVAPFGAMAGFFGLAAGVAGGSARALRRSAQDLRRRLRQRQIFDLARKHAGELSPVVVARELGLAPKEAEGTLDALVDGRNVELVVRDDGQLRYVFRGLEAVPYRP